jgi:hypothetical protein
MKITLLFLLLLATTATVTITPATAQTQPQILAELFCSFGCSNCPTPDSNYYQFVSENPSYGIVVINYHNSISDPTDKFYLESRTDVDARDGSNFYNLNSDPDAFINGYVSQSTPYEWITDTKTDIGFPLTPITPKASIGADGLIHITFTATGPTSGASKVYVALKESNINFVNTEPNGYGNPTGDIWNDIFRAMLPNSTDTTSLGSGETRSFDIAYDPTQFIHSGDWNTQNMTAVVFVQDVANAGAGNYNVESIGTVSLASASAVAPTPNAAATSIRVAGAPSNSEFVVSLPSSERVSIAISDMLGRAVSIVPETMMPAGQTSVDMSGSSLPAGCYFARLIVNGQDAGNTKFIVAP